MILGAQLKDEIKLIGFEKSDDVLTVLAALNSLGCSARIVNNSLTLTSPPHFSQNAKLFIKDSATGLRFLLALLASTPKFSSTLDASAQLRNRPLIPLIKALRVAGAQIDDSRYPLIIKGKKLSASQIPLDVSISSQFLSAILLTAPQFSPEFSLKIKGTPVSWGYTLMTINLLKDFGILVKQNGNTIYIESHSKLINPKIYQVEVDYSCAAYFFALASITDKKVFIPGNLAKSYQPDAGFAQILSDMGADISASNQGTMIKRNKLKGISIDMKNMPDQVPTLAVLGLLAESPLQMHNISHLKYKESNRIKALIKEIKQLNGKIEYENGSLKVFPLKSPPPAITICSHADHRIAMAFSLLLNRYPYLAIDKPEVVRKSFPNFWQEYDKLMLSK